MAKKEFRRGSIRRVLSRIRGSDQGPQFELFRDCICVFECSKWVRATSGSSSNLSADDDDASLKLFFLSRLLDHQNGILSDETRKRTSEKVILGEYVHRTVPNMGPEPRLVWFANDLLPHCPESPHCLREASEVN